VDAEASGRIEAPGAQTSQAHGVAGRAVVAVTQRHAVKSEYEPFFKPLIRAQKESNTCKDQPACVEPCQMDREVVGLRAAVHKQTHFQVLGQSTH